MKRVILSLLLMAGPALAHDPGISNATVDLGTSPISIRFTFSPADLLVAGMTGTDESSLKEQASKICEWRTPSGAAPLHVQSAREVDKTTVEFVMDMPRVAGEFHSLLLPDMPLGHRQLLVFRDHAGESYRIQMLNARSGGEVVSQHDLDRTAPPKMAEIQPPDSKITPWLATGGLLVLGIISLLMVRRRQLVPCPLKAPVLATAP